MGRDEKRASAQAARGELARPSATARPWRGEPRLDLGDKPLFAAEQMGDAGDVEHQPVGAVERGERRVAGAEIGDALQQLGLGFRVGVADDEGGMARAGVGERQAGGQAEPRGGRVDADEPARVVDHGDGRERCARINVLGAPRAVGRQQDGDERVDDNRTTYCWYP